MAPRLLHDDHHADAAIEGPVHLLVGDTTGLLQPIEHRVARPRLALQEHGAALGQYARDIVGQTTARDVGEAVHRQRCGERQHRADIDAGRGEQAVEQGAPLELRGGVRGGHLD